MYRHRIGAVVAASWEGTIGEAGILARPAAG